MPLGAVTEIDAVDLIAALRTIAHIQRVRFSADCQPDQIYDRNRTFTILFEGLIGYRSNLRSHFARANDLGKFGRIQWTTL